LHPLAVSVPNPPLCILFEDEHLVVVSKPAGMLSVPGVQRRLREHGLAVEAVHRLDRDVSGALLLARSPMVRERMEAQFRERRVRKIYWALACGTVAPAEGSLRFPVLEEHGYARVSALGRPAETRYRTIQRHSTTSEVEVEPVTGRYNQIRVHFAHAGFPIVGERKYARGKDSSLRLRSRRIALHALRIELIHPIRGTQLRVEAPLASDLDELRRSASEA
jgi:RluA family pseudouridine synthase